MKESEIPPELGGGKERPYNYRVHTIGTPEHLEEILNGTEAYAYVYWEALAAGYLILAVPNPKALAQRTAKQVHLGLKALTESEAREKAPKIMVMTKESKLYDDIETFLTLLYDRGYVVAEKVKQ